MSKPSHRKKLIDLVDQEAQREAETLTVALFSLWDASVDEEADNITSCEDANLCELSRDAASHMAQALAAFGSRLRTNTGAADV